ncbi:transcriptional regulator MarR family [Coprobacillus sp. CAG:605]|nr:transcriptional regulator MarR family [Coprobacillus sp. CAG:605]
MNNSISIGHELAYTNNLIARRIARGGNNKYAMNISPIQVRIVKYLVKQNNKAILQKDMEYIFNIRRSTVSGVIKTMEKNNIIIRENVKDDNKSKEIKLTNEVYLRANDLVRKLRELDLELLKDINKEDLEVFMRVLKNIQDNLKEERK